MRRMGWPYEFKERAWADARVSVARRWAPPSDGEYLLHIIDSVLASGVSEHLALTTSMDDLMVVARPIPSPPMDILFVRAPDSLKPPGARGNVRIQYMAVSGRDTDIERPGQAAVPLFWRFVEEKYGIKASRRQQSE